MPKITRKKIGSVLIRFLPTRNEWRASYRDRDGHYVRRLLQTALYDEAVTIAERINTALLQNKGYLPVASRANGHSVKDALEESIRHAGGNKKTKTDYVRLGDCFLAWLEQAHSGIKKWEELLPAHISEYAAYLQDTGKAYDTRRLNVYVLRLTARYMTRNYPDRYRLITSDLKLKRDRKKKIRCLAPDQVEGYVAFVKENYPDIYPIVMLQACAGLRILEAINLRTQDVNWTYGTITVTETSRHKPKTQNSDREIPVASFVLDAVRATIKPVKPIEDCIFTNSRGVPWAMDGVCHKIKKSLRKYADLTGDVSIAEIRPHELRATFVTLMRSLRADERILKTYIGHSLNDVMGKHYEAISVPDLRVVARELEMRWKRINEPELHQDCTAPQSVAANR
jgi:integrase